MATRILEIMDDGATARRRWSDEDKARLVSETLEARATVRTVARRHGICASLLYRWRRLFLAERLIPTAGFVPVQLALPGPGSEPVSAPTASLPPGAIEVTTAAGHRVRVTPPIDRAALRLVLDALAR